MGIGVDLAWKQSFSQNASTKRAVPKVNCSSIADFIPNITKFQHGIVYINSSLIVVLDPRKPHLNRALPAIPSNF